MLLPGMLDVRERMFLFNHPCVVQEVEMESIHDDDIVVDVGSRHPFAFL